MQSKVLEKYAQQSHLKNEVLQTGMDLEKQGLYLTPFQRKLLHKSLQTELRPEYRRRIEIMLLADTGQSQTQICETLGCAQETARYWIGMAKAGLAHQWNERLMGRPKAVNEQYLDRLKELASNSPRDYGYPFRRWTAQWLGKHLAKEFGIKVSNCHINRLLKQMGLSTRQKDDAAKAADVHSSENAGITIRDLQSDLSTGFLWHFNPTELSNQEVNQL